MDSLFEHLAQYCELTTSEKQILADSLVKRSLKKNETFFSERKIENELFFVEKGCVRLFYNVDGKDKTAFFYTEGQFICAGENYTYKIQAKENFQAIEDTEVAVFDETTIEKLLAISPKFEVISRIATENELVVSQNVIASFVTKSAEERYVELLDSKCNLYQRVPQHFIASFIGVSPETLSRIKKRVYSKRIS